jgi:hypothetical protein
MFGGPAGPGGGARWVAGPLGRQFWKRVGSPLHHILRHGDMENRPLSGPKRLDSDYYHKTGIRPAAFMGYTTKISYNEGGPVMKNGGQYDDTIPYQVPGFITNFLFYWDSDLMGYGLLSAVDNAKQYLPPVRNQYREDYLAIHGYFNLHIDEVNHRYDTW